MKKVYIARDTAEAQFVKGLIETEGIPVITQGDMTPASHGGTSLKAQTIPSLWVLECDFDHATRIIGEYQQGTRSGEVPNSAWKCPKCQSLIEGTFNDCWNCGSTKPRDASLV